MQKFMWSIVKDTEIFTKNIFMPFNIYIFMPPPPYGRVKGQNVFGAACHIEIGKVKKKFGLIDSTL